MNKAIILITFCAFMVMSCSFNKEVPRKNEMASHEHEIEALKIENVLRESLELTEGVEVVMSYVEIPKATTLPTHYHPGEEFAYILQGSGELSLKDQSKIIVKAGDVVKVPLEHVHSFSTIDEEAIMVVFRVHKKGQPDRILIEDH